MRRLLPLVLLIAAPAAAEIVDDEQVWINATLMGSAKGRLLYFAEIQPRLSSDHGPQQIILRPAIGWQAMRRLALYGGYARVVLPSESAAGRHEDRWFGQASWTIAKLAGGTVSTRSRIEHRRLSTHQDSGWRLRHMVRYVHPLSGRPKVPRALVSYEGFVALNDTRWGARKGYDQGRAFAGFEVPLHGKSTLELGYLNQRINDPGGRIRQNHVASIALFVR
jgi:hypothetical protein